ncbi:MAG: FAD-dependent oxidoreductase [Acholeplasmatales bacterium]|nr:FAD-dependent oxidoreductase [Acholeplasmatales bacterium]
MKDVVIIGYGPAGISAGIYLKRYGFDPIIIGKDNGALEDAHMIENLYGSENMSGHDLAIYGQNQAKKFGIELITDEVINIENMYEYYTVECKNHKFDTKVILLALGKSRNKFHLASKYEGVGVSYCATCDGFFYRKKRIGLVGNGLFMAHELDVLSKMSEDITVFTNGDKLEVEIPSNVKVVEEKIVEFYGDGKLEGVKTKSTDTKLDGCFIALGSQSGFSLASHLGIELKNTDIVVDENFMTNVSGIYAAGDVIGGLLQVSKAISDGAMAATSISKYLKKKA